MKEAPPENPYITFSSTKKQLAEAIVQEIVHSIKTVGLSYEDVYVEEWYQRIQNLLSQHED